MAPSQLIKMENAVTGYSIKSEDSEFLFEGELIAHQDAVVELANDKSCRMNAKTYYLAGGGYVASLEFFRSGRPDEPIVLFEEIESKEDVEKFFYVFDPSEVLCEKASAREGRNDLEKNSRKLGRGYEQMIYAFLDQFQAETLARGTKDKPRPAEEEGTIWDRLGMG